MVGAAAGSRHGSQTMHQVMIAKSQRALKEGYQQGELGGLPVVPWPPARLQLLATASEQDKGGFHVDCGNLFGRFGRLCGCCVLCTVGTNSRVEL
jgi:hypothetical protein